MSQLKIFKFKICESTQSEAFKLFQNNEQAPFAVVADEQTSGKGRLDREWLMQKDSSLALSLGWRTKRRDLSGLSLVIGLGIHQYLQDSRLRLKWPNDLMLQDKKVGGILIETRFVENEVFLVIGIGLNLFSFREFEGIGRGVDPESLLEFLVSQIKVFEESGFSSFQSDFEDFLWKKNEKVFFRNVSSQDIWGTIRGVNSSGALILEEGGRLNLEMSGEIVHE